MSFSDYLELKILDLIFSQVAIPAIATVYVGLSTAASPTDASTFTEPSGNGYARVPVVNNPTNWPAAAPVALTATKSNGTVITFPIATGGDWVAGANLNTVVVYDAPTTGNLLGWGALTTPKPVLNGDTASFAIGTLTITLD